MQTLVFQDEQLTATVSTKSRLSSLVQHHPLASFFVLAYAISWLLWTPLVAGGDSSTGLGLILSLLGSLVPSAVAIMLVAVLQGKAGVRKLLRRLLIWLVGGRRAAVDSGARRRRLEHPARRRHSGCRRDDPWGRVLVPLLYLPRQC